MIPSSSRYTMPGIHCSIVLLLVLAFGSQKVSSVSFTYPSLPFWEPLPFAGLPTVLETKAVFWQDNSVYGKVLTVAGQTDPSRSQLSSITNAVYQLDVGKDLLDLRLCCPDSGLCP